MKLTTLYHLYSRCAITAAFMLAITSCYDRQESPVCTDTPMNLKTFSRTSAEKGETARLFFWDEEHLNNVTKDGTEPYYECNLDGRINDYSNNATEFKTGKYYPKLNTRVYALGFSPDTLKQIKDGNYGKYHLNYNNGEDSTTLVSNNIVGSSVYVFRDVLEFRPATTRIIFRAIRHKNLSGNLYVRNITIQMPEGTIPNVLTWDDENVCYKAAFDENGHKTESNPIKYTSSQLSTTEYRLLGRRYLTLPPTNELRGIKVRAQFSYNNQFTGDGNTTWYRNWPDTNLGETELVVKLKDTDGNAITSVKPGESYVITLVFDKETFTMFAVKQDWEWGGKIPIPVNPSQKNIQ